MPSPNITCEFCSTEMRRNTYANHVKVKHVKEIGQLLFEDLKDSNYSTLQNYASSLPTSTFAVDSKIHPEAEYWFGEQPLFYQRTSAQIQDKPGQLVSKQKQYQEDIEKSEYLRCEKNLEAHRAFLEEALSTISLLDYLKLGKELRIKNPDERIVRSQLSALKKEHEALIESTTHQIEHLKKEVESWKETCEQEELIQPIKSENLALKAQVNRVKREYEAMKQQWESREAQYQEMMDTRAKSYRDEVEMLMNQNDDLTAKLKKQEDTNAKIMVKVKKEAQKIIEKEKEKKKKLKKEAKKAKRLAELSSDSDSDSSDDD